MLYRSVQIAAALTAALLAPAFANDASDADSPNRHDEFKIMEGHLVREKYHSPLPYTYIDDADLPDNFNWGNVNGHSYLTHSLNRKLKGKSKLLRIRIRCLTTIFLVCLSCLLAF
jgi:hypothetical protein